VIVVVSIAPSALHIWKENGTEIKAELRKRMGRT